jgi:NAD(P)-dependent dehydrogenase (short-subunit alcohol dehydrogenase family)
MQKKILITGSTDGIGLETAKMLVSKGHFVLLHGRNSEKLKKAKELILKDIGDGKIETYLADLSRLNEVEQLASNVSEHHDYLDVLINNAGILMTPNTITEDGYDIRFVVNTFAPYLLTKKLLPRLNASSRVINLSSAAQSSVDLDALMGKKKLADMEAYAQSKLAITMWSKALAKSLQDTGPIFVAVNPGSLLGTKMVKEGFGMAGKDIQIGAKILVRAALSDEFSKSTGKYYDNDSQQFAPPHRDVDNAQKVQSVVNNIENMIVNLAP